MRILHVITSLRTGGAEHLLVDLLPQLAKQGHHAELLLFDGTETPFYLQLLQDGITIHSLGKGATAMYSPLNYLRLKRFLARHSYDIIHTHNTPCQLMAALSIGHTRLITTEHNTTNRRRSWKGCRPLDRWMYRKYHRIVCVSHATEKELRHYLDNELLNARISTIVNGVRLEAYREVDSAMKKVTKRQIIMVASFREQKDQPTLIKAMTHLPNDYHLRLVGDGPCRKSCEMLAASLGLQDRITFTGIRTDIPSLLASAEVFVLSSHYEGMPLACIEAMAAGKPVIASDVDGLHEVVEGAGLLFPHADEKALAALIERVCSDALWKENIIHQCRKRAGQYDLSAMVNAYLSLYHEEI